MNWLPPCDHDCCPPTHCELDRLKAENARLAACAAGPGYTPNASLPPLGDGPKRKMVLRIQVSADFEKRLDNQWMVEREIHADRWSWEWDEEADPHKLAEAKAENAKLRGALGTAIELLDRFLAAVHCLSIDREPEVEEQVARLREIYLSNSEQSILSAAVDKARGGPTPPKEYQGFA